MQSTSVATGPSSGSATAAATGLFSKKNIDLAPAVSFIWVRAFKLSYARLLGTSVQLSKLDVNGKMFDSRIQGSLMADGINGPLAILVTLTPMRCHRPHLVRKPGSRIWILFFPNNSGNLLEIWSIARGNPACSPSRDDYVPLMFSCRFGYEDFVDSAVHTSQYAFPDYVPASGSHKITLNISLDRFILTAALALGHGATLVPTWFDHLFKYNTGGGLQALLDAIHLIMKCGFAITVLTAIILNLLLREEIEEAGAADIPILPMSDGNG
ncbi:hypothetical protein HOY80DRAFT_1040185 [Tuber brumale]|nr:hypothetical protein HOY80DRAFT_1040183 [Tuber brumale]KAG0641058.1 hypothetical protein HOY80DRAFT_1040185 [Tuber brumale]